MQALAVAALYEPAAQLAHDVDFMVAAYVPAKQLMQIDACAALYVPTGQAVHELFAWFGL